MSAGRYKRRFQWFAIREYQITCIRQHKTLLIKNIVDGKIGGQPQVFIVPHKFNMAAAAAGFQFCLTIICHRLTNDFNTRCTFQYFYPSDEHERTERAVVLYKARRYIHHAVLAACGSDHRAQHIGVFKIILDGSILIVIRQNSELPALFCIEHGTKHKRAVEARPAKPVNVCVLVYMSDISAVANDTGGIFVWFQQM